MAISFQPAAAVDGKVLPGIKVAAIIAAVSLLPILLLSLLGWHYADALHGRIPFELTNFDATAAMLSSVLPGSSHGDSWLPMMHALDVLHGPGRNTLYEKLFFGAHVRFQYPPTALLPLHLLSTIGLLSVRVLNAVNSLIFLCNAAATGFLAWRLFRPSPASQAFPARSAMAVLAATAAFLFYPLVRAHLLGQIQLWIDFLFTMAMLCWLLERRLAAGLMIGLACTIKPQMGALLLWGLLWREKKFTAGILAALVPLLLLSLFLYGIHNHIAYLDILQFLSRHGEGYFANNSVNGILNWYLSPGDSLRWYDDSFTPFDPIVYAGTLAASLLAIILLAAPPLLDRKRRATLCDLGAGTICTDIGSPVAWEHHYGVLLPLYLVALRSILTMPAGTQRLTASVVVTLSWIFVANFIPLTSLLAQGWAAAAQAYCFFGALLLLGFFLTRTEILRTAS